MARSHRFGAEARSWPLPDLDGIAVPGMPEGAPGMGGTPDPTLEIVGIKDGRIVGVFAVGA